MSLLKTLMKQRTCFNNLILNFPVITEQRFNGVHLCICLHGLHVLLSFEETEFSAGHVIWQGTPWGWKQAWFFKFENRMLHTSYIIYHYLVSTDAIKWRRNMKVIRGTVKLYNGLTITIKPIMTLKIGLLRQDRFYLHREFVKGVLATMQRKITSIKL